MNAKTDVRIDFEAAKALAEWKSLFAAEVGERRQRVAAQAGHPNRVTLSNYRLAAKMAVQAVVSAIEAEHRSDGQQEAA